MCLDYMEPYHKLRDELQPFPHVVQLDVILNISKSKRQAILDRILSEREHGDETEEEAVRNNNFISLLWFHLNKIEKCLEINSEVRKQNPSNINALVTYAYTKFDTGFEYYQKKAITELNKLTEREDYKDLLAIGEAEQAYALSRIGPKYYLKSVELFEKAISQLPEKYLWKFGCAVIYTRCLGISKCVEGLTPEKIQHFIETSIKYYKEIISDCPGKLHARSLMSLGQLYDSLKKPVYPVTVDIVQKLKLNTGPGTDPESLYRRALAMECSRTDEFVLSHCGKSMRYVASGSYKSKLQDSYSLLIKAYEIRQRSFTCDNIAKVLISMVDQRCCPETYQVGGRGRGRARGWCSGRRGRGRRALEYRGASPIVWNPLAKDFIPRTDIRPPKYSGCQNTVQCLGTDIDHVTESMSNMLNPNADCRPKEYNVGKQLKKYINSPRKVKILPDTPMVSEAIRYLQRSVEISKQGNASAMYTLGVIYRRLAKHDLAKAQFRQIISDRDSSTYDKVNAYEQLGFCLLDSSVDGNYSKEQQAEFKEESKFMFMRSIEEAAILVSKIPTLSSADVAHWQGFPTLRTLLNDTSNVENIKDLARLGELVGRHRESLVFYKQLQQIDPEDPDVLCKLIKSYMCQQDFRNALACLRLVKCTKEWGKMIELNADMVDQVHLGIIRSKLQNPMHPGDGLSDVDRDAIRDCCQGLFEHRFDRDYDGDTRDVFILDDPEQTENQAAYLYDWLKETCGLSVTRNDEDVPHGSLSFPGQVLSITNSSCLLVVLGEKTTSRIDTLVCIGQSEVIPPMIATVKTSDNELPAILKGNSSLLMLSDSFKSDSQGDLRLQCLMLLLGLDYKTFRWWS